MPRMRPLDPAFPIDRQIALETGPVVLVNVFTLDAEDEQSFLKTWQDDAAFMKRQPGFISTQLHRAVGDSPTYLNYAVWESNAHFRAAHKNGNIGRVGIAVAGEAFALRRLKNHSSKDPARGRRVARL